MVGKFTKDELKKIVTTAIEQEKQKENIEMDFFPLSFIELYHHFKNDKNYSSISKPAFLSTINHSMSYGYADIYNDLAYLLIGHNLILQKLGIKHQLFRALETSYHEFYHIYQSDMDRQDDYHNSIYYIEAVISVNNHFGYKLYHDNFLSEIKATNYGITKAEQFLKENSEICKGVYEEDKACIEYSKKENEYDYKNYDLGFILNLLHKIVRVSPLVMGDSFIKSIYNGNGTFKNISTILQDQQFLSLDKRIQYEIIASDNFIKSINFHSLSLPELQFVQQALQYRYNLLVERRNYNNTAMREQIITSNDWLKHDCDIVNTISNIMTMMSVSMKQPHMKNIERNQKDISNTSKNIDYVESLIKVR